MFDRHLVGIENGLQLAAAPGATGGIAFGVQLHGPIKRQVRHEKVLLEFFALRMRVIQRLLDRDLVGFLGSAAGLGRLHIDHAGNFLEFGEQIGSCRGIL